MPVQGAGADKDAQSMPPPPPRQPSAKPPQPPTASYHADSQATRLYNGSIAVPSAHPEPSVNQGPGGMASHLASRSNPTPSEEVRSSHPEGVPAGFFQSTTASAAASSLPPSEAATAAQRPQGAAAAEQPAAEGAGPDAQQAEAVVSLEGSTGTSIGLLVLLAPSGSLCLEAPALGLVRLGPHNLLHSIIHMRRPCNDKYGLIMHSSPSLALRTHISPSLPARCLTPATACTHMPGFLPSHTWPVPQEVPVPHTTALWCCAVPCRTSNPGPVRMKPSFGLTQPPPCSVQGLWLVAAAVPQT
jgi:hypothetical protein